MKRPDLNSVEEEDSIEYANGDEDHGNDVISVLGGGVFQVALKCRELSGIGRSSLQPNGHSQQSSFMLGITGRALLCR